MHVRLADESVCVGTHQPLNSYLNIPAIMSAIELTNAEAVHPGYGFLSENPEFAKILEDYKIKFIGPSSKLIQMMGDKIQAKKIAKEYGLPVIEGSDGGVKDKNLAKDEEQLMRLRIDNTPLENDTDEIMRDENISQIDLARAFVESNEKDDAIKLIKKIIDTGTEEEQHEAKLLYMQVK